MIATIGFCRRLIRRDPKASLGAVASIGLVIGLSALLFAIADAAYFHPLPYPEPDRLVSVEIERIGSNGRRSMAYPSIEQVRAWQGVPAVVQTAALFRETQGALKQPVAQRVRVLRVTEAYLEVLGVRPSVGRGIVPADLNPDASTVAVISSHLWASVFGSAPGVLGKSVEVDDVVATVVGVLPPGFNDDIDVTLPFQRPLGGEQFRVGSVYARLRRTVSLGQAADALSSLTLSAGESTATQQVNVTSLLADAATLSRTPIRLMVVMGALILLMTCINVSALVLAINESRAPEFAVRRALGASTRAMRLQVLGECGVLTAAGGVLGLILAWWAVRFLSSVLPIDLPPNSALHLGPRVTAFAVFAVVCVTGIVSTLPALRAAKGTGRNLLAGAGRGIQRSLPLRFMRVVAGIEAAMAVVLTVTAALLFMSVVQLRRVELGFDVKHLSIFEVQPLGVDAASADQFYRSLLAELQSRPDVVSASAVDNFLLRGGLSVTTTQAGGTPQETAIFRAMPGYLQAIGAHLKAGVLPAAELGSVVSADEVVITATAARALFPNENPIGQVISSSGLGRSWQVIGVVSDVKVGGPKARPRPVMFTTRTIRDGLAPLTIVYRTKRSQPGLPQTLRSAAERLHANVLFGRSQSAEDLFGEHIELAMRRAMASVMLAGIGLALALIGMAGISAYLTAMRRREMGIRLACGASPRGVALEGMGGTISALSLGAATGVVASLMLSKSTASLLFGVAANDGPTYAVSVLVVMATAIAAAVLPAAILARAAPSTLLLD